MDLQASNNRYIRCYEGLHLVVYKTIPCLQNALDSWHTKTSQRLQSCTTPDVCQANKKPSARNRSCSVCINWAKEIEKTMYQREPGLSKKPITWTNADPTKFGKDPMEIIKLFSLHLPSHHSYTTLEDFEVASLLLAMANFREFHEDNIAVYDQIMKVSAIRNSLAHQKLGHHLNLDELSFNRHWTELTAFVNAIQSMGRRCFTQETAQDTHDQLTKIMTKNVVSKYQPHALRPLVDDELLKTTTDDKIQFGETLPPPHIPPSDRVITPYNALQLAGMMRHLGFGRRAVNHCVTNDIDGYQLLQIFRDKKTEEEICNQLKLEKLSEVQCLQLYVNQSELARGKSEESNSSKETDEEQIEFDNIVFHEEVGRGAFGTVHRVTFKKPYRGYDEAAAKTLRVLTKGEVEIMQKVRHPNIVTYIGFYSAGPASNILLLELARNGSLLKYLTNMSKEISMDEKDNLAHQAALAIQYLHRNQYLHRDIKPQNCLLFENNTLKLCDFGLAREVDDLFVLSSFKGTYQYIAPEIIKPNEDNKSTFSIYTDIYAYGMLMLAIYTRKVPFEGMDMPYVTYHVGKGVLTPHIPSEVPADKADIMSHCWAIEPMHRPTMDKILKCFTNIHTTETPP